MAVSKMNSVISFLAVTLLLMTVLAMDMVGYSNGQAAGGCRGDMQGVIMECARFVQKTGPVIDPSPQCCSALKTVDVPCVCAHIPPEATTIVDMNKLVHIASFCGIQLPHGFKCGNFTVPPAAVPVSGLVVEKKQT